MRINKCHDISSKFRDVSFHLNNLNFIKNIKPIIHINPVSSVISLTKLVLML